MTLLAIAAYATITAVIPHQKVVEFITSDGETTYVDRDWYDHHLPNLVSFVGRRLKELPK